MLVASRSSAVSGIDAARPSTARDIRWLTPHVTAPRLLLPALQQQRPDALLLAQEIFDELNAEELELLRSEFASIRVLLVTQAPTPELYDQVLRCRFHGVLHANCPPEICPNAVRAVCRGEIWLSRAMLSTAIARAMHARIFDETLPSLPFPATKTSRALSRREQEIVEFVRQGWTNKEIASQLNIMEDTVKKHLQNVFGKLGVRRRMLVALSRTSRFSKAT